MLLKKYVCMAAVLAGLTSNAQTTNLTVRSLSLEDCVAMALKHNLALQIERQNPKIATEALAFARGIYDPLITLGAQRSFTRSSGSLNLQNGQAAANLRDPSDSTADTLTAGVTGLTPFGSTYSATAPLARDEVSRGGIDSTYYQDSGSVSLTQPLMRNLEIDSARWNIQVRRKQLKMSEFMLRWQMVSVVSAVQKAYYDLIFYREDVKVKEMSLGLAKQLLVDNTARVRAGAAPPLDEKQAEAEVATRKADLLTAKQLLRAQETILKNAIVEDMENWQAASLEPSQSLLAVPQYMDIQESWKVGMKSRPDLINQKLVVEVTDLDLKYYRNQTKPDLSLLAKYGQTGLASGAETAFTDSYLSTKNPGYIAGAQIVFPWSNRQAKARVRETREIRIQNELVVQQLEQQVLAEIDNAVTLAKSSFERVDATRQARLYAEAALDAEQKKLANGKSTSYTVLLFQRDLSTARSAEIKALADYNKALAEISRAEGTTLDKLKIAVDFK